MHGTKDPVLPIAFGERLFALAPEPKRFVRLAGGEHDNLDRFGALDVALKFIWRDGFTVIDHMGAPSKVGLKTLGNLASF